MKLLEDRVLVKKLEPKDEVMSSGFTLISSSENNDVRIIRAEVIDVGPGIDERKVTVEKGQIVLLERSAGLNTKINNEDHKIVRMQEIIAIED